MPGISFSKQTRIRAAIETYSNEHDAATFNLQEIANYVHEQTGYKAPSAATISRHLGELGYEYRQTWQRKDDG